MKLPRTSFSRFTPTPGVLYLLAAILLSATGCGRDSSSYFPLDEEGLTWRYNIEMRTMDGVSRQKYMVVNQSPGQMEDKPVFIRKSLDGTRLYYRNTDEGVLFLGKEDTSGLKPVFTRDEHFVFRFPLTTGTQWESVIKTRLLRKTGPPQKTEFEIVAEVPVVSRIEATDDTVSVPSGIYQHCVRIRTKGSAYKNAGNYIGLTVVSIDETSWYAPGVGLVKMVREETTESHALDRGMMTIELENSG